MGTIQEKLEYLVETRKEIRDGLNKLGAGILPNDTFRSYADTIEDIYDSMPKVEESDVESATLDGTIKGGLDIDLKGNTSQTGTPTPDSPQPINVVSGDNEVVVCGKNLFSGTILQPLISDSIGWETIDSQNFKWTGNTGSGIGYFNEIFLNLPSGTYTISGTYTNNLNLQNMNDIKIRIRNADNSTKTTDYTCSYNKENGEKISLLFYKNRENSSGTSTSIVETFSKVMLELSNTATTYEPYQSQTYPINLPVENLFDGTYTKQYVDSDGTLVSSINTALTDYIEINGDLTISTIRDMFLAGIGYYDSSKTFISREQKSDRNIKKLTYTTPNNAKYVRVYINTNISNFTDEDLQSFAIQIEKGTKANSYTPYGTTPIELCKIGDYQDYFTKNSGKNLLNKDGGFTLNSIGSTGVISPSNQNALFDDYIPVKPNTTYTLSLATTISYPTIAEYNGTTFVKRDTGSSTNKLTFTTDSNTNAVRVVLNKDGSSTMTQDIIDSLLPMLELGNDRTIYEPYGTGQWCKYNAIGKVVLDGSVDESWVLVTTDTADYNRFRSDIVSSLIKIPTDTSIPASVLSSHFTAITTTQTYRRNNGIAIDGSGRIIIYNSSAYTTQSAFENWLGSNNTIVYYPLKTPYLSLIEDNSLIEQLDNLESAFSYEGTTNIMQVNNDKPFIMDLKAILDWRN